MHLEAAPVVTGMLERSGAEDIVSRVRPGEKGVDITYTMNQVKKHIEIKPNTPSAFRTYTKQVANWVNKENVASASDVKVITYDAQGNLRWGFHY